MNALIKKGTWLENTSGLYEVDEIGDRFVYVREVIYSDDENSTDYTLGKTLITLTKGEVNHMEVVSY